MSAIVARGRQCVAFAGSQRAGTTSQRRGGQCRVDDAFAARDPTHRISKLLRGRVLHHEPERTRLHGATQVTGPPEGRHDQHSATREL